mgnify:CR=1 FL=1
MKSIWEVFCCKCGGVIHTQKDFYRHETDMEGKQRYFHIPECPKRRLYELETARPS